MITVIIEFTVRSISYSIVSAFIIIIIIIIIIKINSLLTTVFNFFIGYFIIKINKYKLIYIYLFIFLNIIMIPLLVTTEVASRKSLDNRLFDVSKLVNFAFSSLQIYGLFFIWYFNLASSTLIWHPVLYF